MSIPKFPFIKPNSKLPSLMGIKYPLPLLSGSTKQIAKATVSTGKSLTITKPKVNAIVGSGISAPIPPLPDPALIYTYGGAKSAVEKRYNPSWIEETGTVALLPWNQKKREFPVPAIPSQTLKDNLLLSRVYASSHPEFLGFYNTEIQTSFSKTKAETTHENAHHMDEVLGYPSRSEKFNKEVNKYPVIVNVMNQLRNSYRESAIPQEIYSYLWDFYNNNIEDVPKSLRIFFTKDWKYEPR